VPDNVGNTDPSATAIDVAELVAEDDNVVLALLLNLTDIYNPYEADTLQLIVIASAACLLTTEKTVRQSIVPLEDAFNIAASVNAPVPVPAGNVAT
jgi:hypothetical protein